MIKLEVSQAQIKHAKQAHELFTINLILVHIFLSVAIMKFLDIRYAINVPISVSLLLIVWTYFKVQTIKKTASYFVYLHWQIAFNWYKPLLGAYVFYWLMTGGNALLNLGKTVDSMDGTNPFDLIVLMIATVPLFLMVLFLFVVGSGLMFNATKAEVSEKWIKQYPNPEFKPKPKLTKPKPAP